VPQCNANSLMHPLDYDLAELNSALDGSVFARKLHYFPAIGSTNTLAMQAAAAGVEEGTVIFADQQTAGRGRNGHSWHSESGTAILVSLVLRPRIAPAQSLWLSLMAGVAVHDAILRACGMECDLRWPNDLLLARKKVCGILTEISADHEQLRFAVIGVGINVNQPSFPLHIAALATSLQIEAGKRWSRTELLIALLRSMEAEYRRALEAGGNEMLLQRVESISSYARNKRVQVDEAGGYEGFTEGLDARGFLRVRTAQGVRTVLSGSVREVGSPAPVRNS
jgi:BirA family transcriptional regulator, biotin operon repressor / biotin---[acetyl-CoA-carboxylase] ligase